MPFIYFDQDRSTGLDDVHLEIESALSDFHRKNGVQIVMPSLNGIDEIEFHVSFKAKVESRFFSFGVIINESLKMNQIFQP